MMSRHRLRGFSLVELLLTLLVIGLGTGLVVLSLAGSDPVKQVSATIDLSIKQIQLISEEAVLSGETLGLMVSQPEEGKTVLTTGYQWEPVRWRDEQWQLLKWQPLVIPSGLQIDLSVEGQNLDVAVLAGQSRQRAENLPLVVFYPSGEITRFELALSPADQGYREGIRVSDSGQIRRWHEAAQ